MSWPRTTFLLSFILTILFFETGYAVKPSTLKIELPQWETIDGISTIMAERHDIPLTSIMIAFPVGAYLDPSDKLGLAHFFTGMLTRGTKTRSRQDIEDELDRLGAIITVDSGYHSFILRGQALRKNFKPFFELLKDVLQNPTFPEDELQKFKDQSLASLKLRLEDDKRLARTHFMKAVYGEHPYGQEVDGSEKSIPKIQQKDLVDFYKSHIHQGGLAIGGAGDITPSMFKDIVQEVKALLPKGEMTPRILPFQPAKLQGRHIHLIDKPDRTQTQFYIGHAGIPISNPDRTALSVFLTAFGGGLFQAKYMQEIRVKRGWSYGASASLDTRRDGGSFSMYTFPAVADTIPALDLSLQLLDQAVHGELLADSDIEFAKEYLIGSFPFKLDTPIEIVTQKMHNRFVGLPDDHIETYLERIVAVTPQMAREAAKRHLNAENTHIVVLCTAKDLKATIKTDLKAKSLTVVPYDQVP